MSEEPEVPELPEEPGPSPDVAESRLDHFKKTTLERIVSHMNGVGAGIVQSYPMAEVQSWTIQKQEAEAVWAVGDAALATMNAAQMQELAPFLSAVCQAHYGDPANNVERAARLWTKVGEVKANADNWSALSAFVNGLRARASDRIAAAETEYEVYEIESETQTELSAFRDAAGV